MVTAAGIIRASAGLMLVAGLAGCSPQPADNAPGDDAQTATFDGAYTLELGALQAAGSGSDELGPDPLTMTVMVRSDCRDGCVASATVVDPPPELSLPEVRLDYTGKHWLGVSVNQATCGDQPTEEFKTLTLHPTENGGFTGTYRSLTASNNGCNADRSVTLTRTGDVDPAIAVLDPDRLPARVSNRAEGLSGRYRVLVTDTATGETEPPMERKVRTYCVPTGERCVTLLTAENRELTFVFADGAWSYQISEPGRCPDGRPTVVHDRAEFALPVPASDPIEKLTGKRQLTTDAPCAGTTDGTVLVERIGD